MGTLTGQVLERQRQIWQNLYGPARATELLSAAEGYATSHPTAAAADVFRAVDPDEEDDYENFVATRW